MQVVQVLAGFSLGGADILRRAIGKKKADVLAEQKSKFVEGCAEFNNISEEVANSIWAKIETFAGYGFNKSHSAAYAFVAYRTAFLKANYPVEFMAAVLTSELDNAEKIAFLINTCRDMKIPVLPPDVNSSDISFSVDGDTIRFGLGAIKGVGEAAAGKIIESREQDGKFKDFNDFCERCGSAMNSRMIDNLARAGAFDSLNIRRSQILAIAEEALKNAASRAKDKAAGQGSLFDLLGDGDESCDAGVPIPDIPEFEWLDLLKSEKELLGFYVSGHPLQPKSLLLKSFGTPLKEIETLNEKMKNNHTDSISLRLVGMVSSYVTKISKKTQKPFGIMLLEDLESSCELMLYERTLGKLKEENITLETGSEVVLEVTARRNDEGERPRLVVEKLTMLDYAPELYTEELYLHIYEKNLTPETLPALAELCKENVVKEKGAKLILCIVNDHETVFIESRIGDIRVDYGFLKKCEMLLGEKNYRIKAREVAPPPRVWSKK